MNTYNAQIPAHLQQQQHYSSGPSSVASSITPAMLASYQNAHQNGVGANKFGAGTVNGMDASYNMAGVTPAQLLGGMNGNMDAMNGSMNLNDDSPMNGGMNVGMGPVSMGGMPGMSSNQLGMNAASRVMNGMNLPLGMGVNGTGAGVGGMPAGNMMMGDMGSGVGVNNPGMNMMRMPGAMNPQQLLQQRQMQQQALMNGAMGGAAGMGVNPSMNLGGGAVNLNMSSMDGVQRPMGGMSPGLLNGSIGGNGPSGGGMLHNMPGGQSASSTRDMVQQAMMLQQMRRGDGHMMPPPSRGMPGHMSISPGMSPGMNNASGPSMSPTTPMGTSMTPPIRTPTSMSHHGVPRPPSRSLNHDMGATPGLAMNTGRPPNSTMSAAPPTPRTSHTPVLPSNVPSSMVQNTNRRDGSFPPVPSSSQSTNSPGFPTQAGLSQPHYSPVVSSNRPPSRALASAGAEGSEGFSPGGMLRPSLPPGAVSLYGTPGPSASPPLSQSATLGSASRASNFGVPTTSRHPSLPLTPINDRPRSNSGGGFPSPALGSGVSLGGFPSPASAGFRPSSSDGFASPLQEKKGRNRANSIAKSVTSRSGSRARSMSKGQDAKPNVTPVVGDAVSGSVPSAAVAGGTPLRSAVAGPTFVPPGAPAGVAAPSASSLPPSIAPALAASQSNRSIASDIALPPMPVNVNISQSMTRVTVVPLTNRSEDGKRQIPITTEEMHEKIPSLSEEEIKDVHNWVAVDKAYEARFRLMQERMTEETRNMFGPNALTWWERGAEGRYVDINKHRRPAQQMFDLRYPRAREEKMRKEARRKGFKREGIKLPGKISPEAASRPERLVSIRLEFDVDHHRMRDTFVWNLNDPVVTPEMFAQLLVDDYKLSNHHFVIIVKSIKEQLSDYQSYMTPYESNNEQDNVWGRGKLKESDAEAKWWGGWRKRLFDEAEADSHMHSTERRRKRRKLSNSADHASSSLLTNVSANGPMAVDVKAENDDAETTPNEQAEMSCPEPNARNMDDKPVTSVPMPAGTESAEVQTDEGDLRIVIKLDIIVGSMKLDDQFEWDLENETVTPEEFAEVYSADLGLNGEFKTAIVHSIREQVQTYQKSLFLVGHSADGPAIPDEELRNAFLPSLTFVTRPLDQVQSFTPSLSYVSDGEIERHEREREKDMNRRRKRNTRGRRGVALPDREPIRTYRTPAIGFPPVDANAAARETTALPTRRAAATAASQVIANMVASENGTPYSPPSVPSVPVHNPTAAPKEKKIKGLFKAPSIDVSLRKARAEVQAPTPSTAYEDPSAVPRAETETAQTVMGALTEKQARMLAAKRVRELEREAKERETLNSQHPTMINGEWHCANCGVPKDLATGIRKGPSGERTLCGNCGKYYHRNKRNRPVPYSTERSFHEKVKYDPTTNLKPKSRKKRLISSRGQTTVPATPSDFEMQRTPSRHTHDTQSPPPSKPNNARAASPASSSSASDAPLSHATKMPNGVASHGNAVAPPSKSAPSTEPPAEPPRLASILSPAVARTAPVSPHGVHSMPPEWLVLQVHKMQDRYPDDRFEAILRKGQAPTPEWRIKCLDCPGKLYTPGPGETLTNYEVHLKNRQHRQRVNERLQKQAAA